jgi:hypothetical protein
MTKTNMRKSGKPLKVTKKGPAKTRRLRRKRKLRHTPAARARVRHAGTPDMRGNGPPVKNVDVEELASAGRSCPKCADWRGRPADKVVTWKHWHRGEWRTARRALCGKHAGPLAKRLGQARRPR